MILGVNVWIVIYFCAVELYVSLVCPFEVVLCCLCSSAAQKARDDFDEAERALREVDDQMKWVCNHNA